MNTFISTSLCFWFSVLIRDIRAFNWLQCPHDESQCRDDMDCTSGAMGRRAGYFCSSWPFYSGGFAECCDENYEHSTCTHSVYSHETNNVFCDFWYMTQTSVEDELQLCDCKVNNGHYCISWICATIAGYDFDDTNHSNADLLAKLLLPNQIEIFGVHQCGYFTDHALISRNHEVKQYCYKYDDFKSCYCKPNDDANATQLLYCAEWVCHQYVNKAKNSLSFDADYDASKAGKYHNYWNASDRAPPSDVNVSSVIDMMKLSLKTTHEEYRCTSSYSNTDRIANHYDIVDKTECVEWKGNVVESDASSFRVMSCATEGWNSDTSTFTQIAADQLSGYNMSTSDLVDTYSYKWQCHAKSMNMRRNDVFLNFYMSTIIWSICVGCVALCIIFKYMQYKYITLSSFFCVQAWFLFIFGSISAVHGGLPSFVIYFAVQFPILLYIVYLKCKHRGKQPYGALTMKYEFDVEESVSRVG
eukprot:539436_1